VSRGIAGRTPGPSWYPCPVQHAQDAAPFVHEIAHTADVGFVVEAPSRTGCFERAALALAGVIADTGTVVPRDRRELGVAAGDAEGQLQALLHEVLLLAQLHAFLVSAAEVSEAPGGGLRAVVAGEPYDPARHRLHGEVKAVTWHGLAVEPTGDGWRARVILDV
jgi:protein archease